MAVGSTNRPERPRAEQRPKTEEPGTGQHGADDGSFGRSAGGAFGRGIALIVLALLVGYLLLRSTDDPGQFEPPPDEVASVDDPEEGDDGASEPTTPGTAATGGTGGTGSTTVPSLPGGTPLAPRTPDQVQVLVANGSGTSGVARTFADQVAALGYTISDPSNAVQNDLAASTVYFTDGFEAEASQLAASLSVTDVQPLPTPLPVPDLREATVVLVVGADLAAG